MTIAGAARRGLGKLLVAIGLLGLVGLAFATPLAFTAQTGTVLELLLLAALGSALCLALLLIGDLLARPGAAAVSRDHVGAPGLPKGRDARDRRFRASDAPGEPTHSVALPLVARR